MKLLLVLNILVIFCALKVSGSEKVEDINEKYEAAALDYFKASSLKLSTSNVTQNIIDYFKCSEIIKYFKQKVAGAEYEPFLKPFNHKSTIEALRKISQASKSSDNSIFSTYTRLSSFLSDNGNGSASKVMKKIRNEMQNSRRGFIRCNYARIDGADACELEIFNPSGRDDFEYIEGQHPPNQNNSHIHIVEIFQQETRNIPSVICRQFPNLQELRVVGSFVEELTHTALAECQNLMRFKSKFNLIRKVPENLFNSNQRLLKVTFDSELLEKLPARLFRNNPQIIEASFAANQINEVPHGLFDGLRFLRAVNLQHNRISTINAESFGSSIFSLTSLNVNDNRIVSIDENFWNQTRNLQFLHLKNNFCVSQEFFWVNNNRLLVEYQLEACFVNFGTFMRCNFGGSPTICFMNIFNPNGRDDFDRIEGDFPADAVNFNVTSVEIFWENTTNIPHLICSEFQNLRALSIIRSGLTTLTARAFESCRNLLELTLAFNPITSIPGQIFIGASSLRQLSLPFNQISSITQQSFTGIAANLQILNLNGNSLSNLSPALFSMLDNVNEIDLAFNLIQSIYSGSFGSSLRNLRAFHAEYNRINSINAAWFDNSTSLQSLKLSRNLCINNDFQNVQINRDFVRNELQTCFENFDGPPDDGSFIRCNYTSVAPIQCIMSIRNSNGRDDFRSIEGQLPSNLTYAYVEAVDMTFQYTINIPSIICRQFTELKDITAEFSLIEVLSVNAYQHCRNLESLSLAMNSISVIFDGTFVNLINLKHLDLGVNKISSIGPETFFGLVDVQFISLAWNSLTELGLETFGASRNLSVLHLHHNEIRAIDSRAFGDSLRSLREFWADFNFINYFDWIWLESSTSIEILKLSRNHCVNRGFENIQNNLEFVRNQLQSCFRNFDRPKGHDGFIQCRYEQIGSGVICYLNVDNPNGHDNFDFIEGDLPPNNTISNVRSTLMFFQNTNTIPSIICTQFCGLEEMYVRLTAIPSLTIEAFRNCSNLEILEISNAQLTSIPDNSFLYLTKLHTLDLHWNSITSIRPGTFVGLNELQVLILNFNFIRQIPHGTFNKFTDSFLKIIDMGWNELSTLDSRSFGNSLRNFQELYMDYNLINEIDPEWFATSESLKRLDVSGNLCVNRNFVDVHVNRDAVIEELQDCFSNFDSPTADDFIRCNYVILAGIPACILQIENVNGRDDFTEIEGFLPPGLSYDQIVVTLGMGQQTRNIPSIICRKFPNLMILALMSSSITEISSTSLQNCQNLLALEVSGNGIQQIPPDFFSHTPNLGFISFTNNLIQHIPPNLFHRLPFLEIVWLNVNRIQELPYNLFESPEVLTFVSLSDNQLTTIDSRIFGTSRLRNFVILSAANNRITSIDGRWFEAVPRLNTLDLFGNVCSSQFFTNIGTDRDLVRRELQTCFDNFEESPGDGSFIRCDFVIYEELPICEIVIFNPDGRDDFTEVRINGPPEITRHDIIGAVINFQNTTIIPSIICEYFPNLLIFAASYSGITNLSSNSLQHCQNLLFLSIYAEQIREIHENFFRYSINLIGIELVRTSIEELPPNLFRNLERLEIVYLFVNRLRELPHGLFVDNRNLVEIELFANQITTIDSRTFGSDLSTLEVFLVGQNQVESIDRRWFESAVNLQRLNLVGNLCNNEFFENVNENRDFVARQLQRCFDNFEPPIQDVSISCDYVSVTTCEMRIFNPNGDEFGRIEGQLPVGGSYSQITTVNIQQQHTSNIPAIICLQFPNVQHLTATNSRLTRLSSFAFMYCHNLVSMSLNSNEIPSIPHDTFRTLVNLQFLSVASNRIGILGPQTFDGLLNLLELNLGINLITELPSGTFSHLRSIIRIELRNNQIRSLNAASFDVALLTLEVLNAEFNQINQIEQSWFEGSTRLDQLFLFGNICVNHNFENVQNNRDAVRNQLQSCFNNI